MDINEIRRENLKVMIEQLGDRQKFIAKTGKSDAQISQLLSTSPSSRNIGTRLARELEKKCGYPEGFMDQQTSWYAVPTPNGKKMYKRTAINKPSLARPMSPKDLAEAQDLETDITDLPAQYDKSDLYSQEVVAWETESDLPQDQFVFVPRLEVELSAGNGNVVWEVCNKGEPQAFRLEWLQKKGLQSKNLRCMYAHGDSMEPYIQDGDALLVDLSETEVTDNQVYAIRYGDALKVKRLFRRFDKSLRIVSDNREHPEEIVQGEDLNNIQILGKVVWRGG